MLWTLLLTILGLYLAACYVWGGYVLLRLLAGRRLARVWRRRRVATAWQTPLTPAAEAV
ncbi:MAG: hypothetical protein ACLFV3_09625 [Phycisphaeraceae bacterium]